MAKYKQEIAGEWIYPIMKNYRIRCCDCGLVHIINFDVVDKENIRYTAIRDNRATGQARRWMNK